MGKIKNNEDRQVMRAFNLHALHILPLRLAKLDTKVILFNIIFTIKNYHFCNNLNRYFISRL